MDITANNLEAAIIDQQVAGRINTPYAFVTTVNDKGWILGVAVANEPGYNPIFGKTFTSETEAGEWAKGLNEHIGLTPDDTARIIISTMGGRRFY